MENTIMEDVQTEFATITRYPKNILTPTADFEEDLGIDSVKLSEIFVHLQKKYQLPENLDIAQYPTQNLQDVANLISEYAKTQPSQAIVQPKVELRPTPFTTSSPEKTSQVFSGKVVVIRGRTTPIGQRIEEYLSQHGATISSLESETVDFYICCHLQEKKKPLTTFSPEDWEQGFDESIVQFHQEVLQVAKKMENRSGKVLAFSTTAAKEYSEGDSFSGAIHAAIESLCRYFCVELSDQNIQVNCLAIGRVQLDDIPPVVGQLLKNESRFINGTTIVMDNPI